MDDSFREKAKDWKKGHFFDEFDLGQIFEHHWGRTINEGDNSLFTALTLSYNPLYFNQEYARAYGHPGIVIHPMLVFLTVFGLSVEDLSEVGGVFLGVEKLVFSHPVHVGDTLTARSAVINLRNSESRQNAGIATWYTEGFNQRQQQVVAFRRTNLVNKRGSVV